MRPSGHIVDRTIDAGIFEQLVREITDDLNRRLFREFLITWAIRLGMPVIFLFVMLGIWHFWSEISHFLSQSSNYLHQLICR